LIFDHLQSNFRDLKGVFRECWEIFSQPFTSHRISNDNKLNVAPFRRLISDRQREAALGAPTVLRAHLYPQILIRIMATLHTDTGVVPDTIPMHLQHK
jgi:hypothetical protein